MQKPQSIDDVNALIPELKRVFGRIAELNQRSSFLTKDIQSLFDIWGEQLHEEQNPDFGLFQEKRRAKEAAVQEMQRELAKVQEMGGVVKDVNAGLVDFSFERGGETIYLCWKVGEDRIRHWHPAQGGFAARRPIEELAQTPL